MSRIALTIGVVLALVLHLFLLNVNVVEKGHEPSSILQRVKMRAVEDSEAQSTKRNVEQVQTRQSSPETSVAAESVPAEVPDSQLARTTPPDRNTLAKSGDYGGREDVESRPELRIDWGSSQEAMSVVNAAGLRLVMLSGQGEIVAEIHSEADAWKRSDGRASDLSRFSNRVRIVDSTPAFRSAAALRRGDERLAILIPLSIEHMLKTEQVKSAAIAGIAAARIRSFYGRFHFVNGRVEFAISELERRS